MSGDLALLLRVSQSHRLALHPWDMEHTHTHTHTYVECVEWFECHTTTVLPTLIISRAESLWWSALLGIQCNNGQEGWTTLPVDLIPLKTQKNRMAQISRRIPTSSHRRWPTVSIPSVISRSLWLNTQQYLNVMMLHSWWIKTTGVFWIWLNQHHSLK